MNSTYTFKLLPALLFTVLFFMYSPASGQWSTNPAINNAICDLPSEDAIPKVRICPDGNIYIAFLANVGGSYTVRLQKLDSQGNELWPHNGILISDHPTDSWTSDWDMEVDITNHAVLTFSDIRAGGDWQAYAYRISPTGTFAWGANGIQLSYSGFNAAPKVTCTAAGNAVFAWSSDNVIKMQKINPAGVKQWGTNGITLSSANNLSWPQLLPVGTDDVILKYYNDQGNPPYPIRHILAQRYNASGSPVWASPTMISNAGGISSWTQKLSIVNDGSDGFYIAWHDDRDNNQKYSAFVQHINSSGTPVFTANGVELSTVSTNNHLYAHVALPTGSSEVFVFWNEMDGGQDMKGIYGQKLSASGSRLWGNSGMTFIPLSSTNVMPEAVSGTATDMMVMYSQGVYQLKAMRIATDGSFVWNPTSAVISSAASAKVHTAMSNYANSQWIVSWEDNRNGVSDIYAQNISIDGTLGPYATTYGNIQGHVTLTGGTGNITQVVVSNGTTSTFPNQSGDYFMQVETGTYTVTASLNGYSQGTVSGVVVLENQTTNNVDFELIALPTTGWIEGTVTLANGNGDVTQTIIAAGAVTTNPDANGYYIMEVGVGTWDVSATLDGYAQQMRSNIIVTPGGTTSNINFILSLLPATGFLYGTVTIEGNMANMMQVTITSNAILVVPNNQGAYLMELPVGYNTVTAEHPYTSSHEATVLIEPGSSTLQNFSLSMLRRDLVITCHDQHGNVLNGTFVEVTGPEGNYSGSIENDSLVFAQVPYGHYTGEATYESHQGLTDTIIDGINNKMDFTVIISSAQNENINTLMISPNPVKYSQTINLGSHQNFSGRLIVYDIYGRKCGVINITPENSHTVQVSRIFQNHPVKGGLYIFRLISDNNNYSAKVLIQD